MTLTKDEILLIFDLIEEKHGHGYAKGPVGRLQAKLSIMLEVIARMEQLEFEPGSGF